MRNCYFIVAIFLTLSYCESAFIIDDIINTVVNTAEAIQEEVFRKVMIKQTYDSFVTLKKNYEETTKFYKEIQQLQENLYGISEEAKQKFLERLNYTVKDVQKEIEQKIKEIDEESKKIFNTKIVDYIKSNWDLGNKIVQTVEDRRKELQKKICKLSDIAKNSKFLRSENEKEEARAKVEQIKNELLGMQIEILNQQNLLLLKIFEIQNNQLQQMLVHKQRVFERQKAYIEATKKFLENKKKQFSQQDYIRRYSEMK